MKTCPAPTNNDRWDIVRSSKRGKAKQLRGKSRAQQAAWGKWKPHNKFGVLAEDSDSSTNSEDDDSVPTSQATNIPRGTHSSAGPKDDDSVPTLPATSIPRGTANSASSEEVNPVPTLPAASIPRGTRDHNKHKEAQDPEDVPGRTNNQVGDTSTPKESKEDPVSDADSAVHSGEEESHNLPFWACPLCKKPLEDLTTTLKQHIEDDHTLTNPRASDPS